MLLELFFMKSYFWALCLTGLLLYYIYSRRKLYWLSWQLPGPNPALPLIGNCFLLWNSGVNDVFPLLDGVMSRYRSGVVRFWLGPKLVVFVKEPGVASQVNQKTLYKSDEYQYLGQSFCERGLFTTNNLSNWRKSKKAYLLVLGSENLKSFIPKIHQECSRVVDAFDKYARTDQSVHTGYIFDKFTLACATTCALDFDIHTKQESDIDEYLRNVHSVLETFQRRLAIPPYRNNLIYTLLGLKAKELKIIKKMGNFVRTILDHHKANSPLKFHDSKVDGAKTFLEHLLQGDPTMAEDDIIVHMLTTLIAATDTLAPEYTMLLLLLAQNPLVQQKVHNELLQVLGDDPNLCPSVEDLNKLKYLDRVLKECLRMFPAGPFTARKVLEDFTVTTDDNKEILFPRGATVAIFIRNIQNNPLYFENPNSFDPDRWLPENSTKRPPLSYLPFSNGPRNCVGGRYALLQMKTFAATALRKFEVLTSKSCETFEDIHVEMSMTMRIGTNCQVRFRRRENGKLGGVNVPSYTRVNLLHEPDMSQI